MAAKRINQVFKPLIHASEISGLIGRHVYRTRNQAIYGLIARTPLFKKAIRRFKLQTNNRKEEIVNEFIGRSRSCIQNIAKYFEYLNDVENIDDLIRERVRTTIEGLRYNSDPRFCEQNIRRRFFNEFKGQVQMERGKLLEGYSLDQYANRKNIRITKRNNEIFEYSHRHFTIRGKIDGVDERRDRIIEIKNRIKFIDTVPEYDKIQCHIYMLLTGYRKCVLVEHFPNNTIRETFMTFNQGKINRIQGALKKVIKAVRRMTDSGLRELINQVDREYDNATA